jgi:lysozyme
MNPVTGRGPSERLYAFIEREEGCVLHSYQDKAKRWTIGIGSTMYKTGFRVQPGETITHDTALDLLRWEVGNKASSVTAFTRGVLVTQNQYDMLVDFAYNEGIGGLQNSTLIKKVRLNPNDASIRDEFAKYNKIHVNGVLEVCDDLTGRRKREADLYFTPDV